MTPRANPLVLTLVLLASAPLQAQSARPERPYRGLFGGGVGNAEQVLTVSTSLGAGYSTDIIAEALGREFGSRGWGIENGRGFGQFSGGINYALSRDRVQAGISFGSAGRYFPEGSRRFVVSHSGGAGLSVQLARSTRLSARQTVGYQPYNALALFPELFDAQVGDAAALDQDLDTGGAAYLTYGTSVDLGQQLSRRASLSFGYSTRLSDFPDRPEYRTQGGRGSFRLNLARGLDLRLGYGYREGGEIGVASKVRSHDIIAGIDFSRAWSVSLSRRTTFSMSTGSSMTVDDSPQTGDRQTRFRLTGNARLNHEMGRTWDASMAYGRNMRFSEALREPVFSDSASASVGGMINRRLQFRSTASASFGSVGFGGRRDDFVSYRGTASLTTGLTRYAGLGVTYSYYRSSLDDRVTAPSDLPRDIARQSVRAYVTLWAPLVYRAGRQNGTR